MKKLPITLRIGFIVLLSTLINSWRGAPDVNAAGHSNLEEGLPPQVGDAYPVPCLGREAQGLVRYERTDREILEGYGVDLACPRKHSHGELLGNYPQGFSQLVLIRSALTIAEAEGQGHKKEAT